jgi:hypothetical protein
VAEWRLFDGDPPAFCDPEHLRGQPWMRLEHQPGFKQRADMVAALVRETAATAGAASITDLGCGDGSLLAMLADVDCPKWGYEIGDGDVTAGRLRGLDIRQASILDSGQLEYGELLIASEVLEHLADPEGFLRGLPGGLLVVSSPSMETGDWHNEIHAWAWDFEGYWDLVRRSGWMVSQQVECDGGLNTFGGIAGMQKFQAIVAVR